MTAPKYLRGARVVVRPPDGVPELASLAGVTGLVVDTTHPEHPEATVLSLDASPGSLALVSQEWLAPVDDKPCVTLDPRCCALTPCAGCLVLLQAHLREALGAAGIAGEQGKKFVETWNTQRALGRAQALDLVRQARAYAVAEVERKAQITEPTSFPDPSEPGPSTVSAPEAADTPQVIPTPSGEDVEKKSSTKRRKTAKTAAPSSTAPPSERDSRTPAAEEGATGDGEAAG